MGFRKEKKFVYNFCNFRRWDFISLILGVLRGLLVKTESYYSIVSIKICLRIFFFKNKFSRAFR